MTDKEVAAAYAAQVIAREPELTGALGARIRMLELQLSWALGIIEARVAAIDLTAAYHELYTPGPVVRSVEQAMKDVSKKGSGTPLPGGVTYVADEKPKRSSIFDR